MGTLSTIQSQVPPFKCFCEDNKSIYSCKCWSTAIFTPLQSENFPEVFHLSGKTDEEVAWVDLSGQSIAELPNFSQKFTKLRILTATNCSLINIKLYRHSRLEEINFKHNKISSTNVLTFMMNSNLKFLDLSHNLFKKLEFGTFQGLMNLEILNLSHNQISTIEDTTFFQTPKLYQLNLERNYIKKLSKWMFFLNR